MANQVDLLLLVYVKRDIDDEEFLLSYDLQKSNNSNLSYWKYNRFGLQNLTEDECNSEFRFHEEDIPVLKNI